MKLESLYFPDLMILIAFAILYVLFFYSVTVHLRREHSAATVFRAAVFILLQLGNLAALIIVFNLRHGRSENIWNDPASVPFRRFIVCEIVLASVFAAALIYDTVMRRRSRAELTNDSMAEAVMNLPNGLCFADRDGRIILSNALIRRQVPEFTGYALVDANDAWNRLKSAAGAGTGGMEPEMIQYRRNGQTWMFRRRHFLVDGVEYQQIDSADATRRMQLMDELRTVNTMTEQQNQRTRELIANIVHAKSEQEILDMQSHVHHEVGQCIILARRCLDEGCDAEKITALLDLWEETFRFRFNENENKPQDVSGREQEICTAAEICGYKVFFRGSRPESETYYRLYLAAAREAMTNAIRHAQATEVYIDGIMQEGALCVTISDNGSREPGRITEGVGLGTLRKKLEAVGVLFNIHSEDGVRLILTFPKGVTT